MRATPPKQGQLAVCLCALTILASTCSSLFAQSDKVIFKSDFESPSETYNPWAGVDAAGEITVPTDSQLCVDENGSIRAIPFSPGLAVGDLNGDGLQDLMVADARGYLWYYPNSGSAAVPKFTYGEVLPLWLGTETIRTLPHNRAIVPRLQLVDVNGDGKLDILAGTYEGRLYYFPNQGTTQQPVFTMPRQIEEAEIPTSAQGAWCNYLSPDLVNWFKDTTKYLIMGEGTYSANSIYMLKNLGSADRPAFSDTAKRKIIPGMGREDLIPQVVDWDGDGKPDILCGERAGYITLFLNKSGPNDETPKFDEGTRLTIGGKNTFGPLTLPCVADLNGNHLPNLLISNVSGKIVYAQNSGTAGNPNFAATPSILKGTNPYPKILVPKDWSLGTPFGDSYNLLVVTNATVEPGFELPPDHVGKNALKAYVFPFNNRYFKTRYFVPTSQEVNAQVDSNEHDVAYEGKIPLAASKQYPVSFYIRTDGEVTETRIQAAGAEYKPGLDDHVDLSIVRPFTAGPTWAKVTDTLSWESRYGTKGATVRFGFSIRWHGQGTVYLDDVVIQSE